MLDQTYQDFEIIVVDDCSTDKSEEAVKSFRDPRIRFFRNEKNLGMVPNTNKALGLARGEFVGILHSDDFYDPKMLETSLKMFDQNPEVGFTYSSYVKVNENGETITKVKSCDRDRVLESREVFKKLVLRNYIISPSVVIVRRKCYEDVGKFDGEFPRPNDWNMWLRISLKYDSACLSDCLCSYRMHDRNTRTQMYNSFEIAMDEYLMVKKLQKKIHDPDLSPFVEEGVRRAKKRVLLNSVGGGLLKGGRRKALTFFFEALKLEKRNSIWPATMICLFTILLGSNEFKEILGNLFKKLPITLA